MTQHKFRKFSAWVIGLMVSVTLHVLCFVLLNNAGRSPQAPKKQPIRIKVIEKQPAVTIKEEPEPEPPHPPPPPPKPKPKPPRKETVATNRIQPPTPQQPVEAIQGFSKESLAPASGPGIAVPIGNTVMTKDTGKRVKDAAPITGDQSQDARIIPNSYIEPSYTDAAIDANLEGRFIVDVFVDEHGAVAQAELRKKIGYGMDQKIIAAVKSARFIPRKNRLGLVESGWTNVSISLKLP